MVTSKLIAKHIKTINNELDMKKHEKKKKLKEEIKHRKKAADLEKNKKYR